MRAVAVGAFPTERVPDARFLVGAQWASNAATPEEAALEFAERMASGLFPQIQVVNFGDGFRWTYEVVTE